MNVLAWLEYELANYESAIHRFNQYTTRTPPLSSGKWVLLLERLSYQIQSFTWPERQVMDPWLFWSQLAGAIDGAYLQRGKTPSKCVMDMTLNTLVMLELWGMQSTPLLPSLPGPLWPGVRATDRVLSIGLTKLYTYAQLNCWK